MKKFTHLPVAYSNISKWAYGNPRGHRDGKALREFRACPRFRRGRCGKKHD